MNALRHFLMQRRMLAAWLMAAALAMRVLVPAGFMPVAGGGTITVQLCSGYGAQTVEIAMPGMAMHHGQDDHDQPGKAEMPCAFSGLSAPSLAAADPVQLALAILFVLAIGLRPTRPLRLTLAARLRPPLRAPPAHT